jgi:phosphoenolpyruvate carboxykinase (GTP)
VFERCDDQGGMRETPIGLVPSEDALDTRGLDLPADALAKLVAVDPEEWREQLPRLREHFAMFGDKLPDELAAQLEALEKRLSGA